MQLSSLPIEEIEQSAGFGFDDRFCYQLPGPIQNRHRNRFLVNIQADILDIATQHAGYLLGGKVILQPDHFPSRCVILFEPTVPLIRRSKMRPDGAEGRAMPGGNPSAHSVASTDPGGCCGIPPSLFARRKSLSGEAQKR